MQTRVFGLVITGIVVFILGQVSAAQPALTPTNLALGKPVVASSVESLSYPAHYANDGDPSTRWSSQFEDNQWIAIDLEASYDVHQVILNWETAYGESYDIDISFDGFNWETVFEETNGDGGIDVINFGTPVPARFVRMVGLVRGTGWGFSLWEFEIYEHDPAHRYVNGSGLDGGNDCLDPDNPCATVAYAISQANPGNTIEIAEGIYTESFMIDKSLALQGAGQENTIIQAHAQPGMASERVITLPEGLVVDIAGITIRHGKATGGGSSGRGGGISNAGSTLKFTNITFHQNEATYGGGMYNSNSSPVLTSSIFSNNTANDQGQGGGMYNFNSSPMLTSVTFSENTANNNGGGMSNTGNSSPTLADVAFIGNEANEAGGGMRNTGNSSPTLIGVEFSSNEAKLGGGLYNASSSPKLTSVMFTENTAGESGGGMYNTSSSPTLTGVTFNGNTAGNGGGMANFTASAPVLTNVEFIGNEASGGGGMFSIENSSPALINATFSGNIANVVGGGMLNLVNSSPTVINTIIWNNTAAATNGGNEIFNEDDSSTNLRYSLYQDEPGDIVEGGGFDVDGHSLTSDPLFANAANGDLHLQEDSPAIDAGDNTQCPPLDLQGVLRPIDGDGDGSAICDMGAFEYSSGPYQLYLPLMIERSNPAKVW